MYVMVPSSNLYTPTNACLGALDALDKEIVPNLPPAAASVEYRKSLAISLFYKVRQTDGQTVAQLSFYSPYLRKIL